MTAKDYLSGAWQLKLRIENMTQIAAVLRSVAEMVTPHITHTPKPAARNIHKSEDTIVKLLDYEERIEAERRKLDGVMQRITSVSDSTAQAIIIKRYIERKTWVEIAAEVHVSERHTRRVHEAALDEIEQLLKVDRECP